MEFRNRNSLQELGARGSINCFADDSPMPDRDLHDTISAALSRGTLFGGGLLSTNEPTPVWRFTSEMPAETLALFRQKSDDALVTSDVIGMGAGWVCWVVAYQVGRTQHRWFLPLAGAQVSRLVRDVRRTGLRLWMDAESAETVFEARLPVSRELSLALRTQRPPSVDRTRAAENLIRTAAHLLTPSSLKPADGNPLASEISVTAVIPEDLRLDAASEAAAAIWRASRSAKRWTP